MYEVKDPGPQDMVLLLPLKGGWVLALLVGKEELSPEKYPISLAYPLQRDAYGESSRMRPPER